MGAKVKNLQVKIDPTHGNQLVASWEFDNSKSPYNHIKQFRVEWWYGTGAGYTFAGEQQDITRLWSPIATWSPPDTAYTVTCKVKPIAATHKVTQGSGNSKKEVDVAWFTGDWVSVKINITGLNLPVLSSAEEYVIENGSLKIAYSDINQSSAIMTKATHVQFQLYQNGSTFGGIQQVAISGLNKASLVMSVSQLNLGKAYSYRVRTIRVQTTASANMAKGTYYGTWSAVSGEVWTRPEKPKAPTTCQARSTSSIYLKWPAVMGITSFDIEYVADDPTLFDVSDTPTTKSVEQRTEILLDKDLTPGSRYYFRIRANNSGGSSDWSDIVSSILGTKPSAPTTWSSETIVKTGDKFLINWLHNSDDSSKMTKSVIGVSIGTVGGSGIEWGDETEYKVVRTETTEATQTTVNLSWDGPALGVLSAIDETYTCEIDTNPDNEDALHIYRKNTISINSELDPALKYYILIDSTWTEVQISEAQRDQEKGVWVVTRTGVSYNLYTDVLQTEYKIRWRIKTAGVATVDGTPTGEPLYGDYSTVRENSMYEAPTLSVSVYKKGYTTVKAESDEPPRDVQYYIRRNDVYEAINYDDYDYSIISIVDPPVYGTRPKGSSSSIVYLYKQEPVPNTEIDVQTGSYIIHSFPFYIYAESNGSLQYPISFAIQIKSTEAYEDIDIYGNPVVIPANQEIFSQNYDVSTNLLAEFMPSNIDLENSQTYSVTVTVSMDSGLSATNVDSDGNPTTYFSVDMGVSIPEPNVEAIINDDYSASVHSYIVKEDLSSRFPDLYNELYLAEYPFGSDDPVYASLNDRIPEDQRYIVNFNCYVNDPYNNTYVLIDQTYTKLNSVISEDEVEYVVVNDESFGLVWYAEYQNEQHLLYVLDDAQYNTIHTVSAVNFLYDTDSGTWGFSWDSDPLNDDDPAIASDLFYSIDGGYQIVTAEYDPDILFNIYRRELDGSFITIAEDIPNDGSTYVSDPHPALDYARYRVVAVSSSTGDISYSDVEYYIGGKAIVMQWDGSWENLESLGDDISGLNAWNGATLILPYNIDVSDSYSPDTSMVTYIGRKNPVSYYGTQLGMTSTWSSEIPKSDTETIALLRRLSNWMGDVYVREPSGTGYWANVTVSFSLTHCEVTVPISFNITRVEGGI